jgi:hypothetical protein
VRTYLVGRGIDLARLVAQGFGEGRPIDSNKREAGRDRNRRVEFNIIEIDEKPVDADPTAPKQPEVRRAIAA